MKQVYNFLAKVYKVYKVYSVQGVQGEKLQIDTDVYNGSRSEI